MGTYGDNFTREFFKRTINNLESYERLHESDPDNYPNNITQIINSLLGLVVFIKEDQQNLSDQIYNNFNDKVTVWNYGGEKRNSNNLIRHLRNAIAHARIEAQGSETSIESLTFEDKCNTYKFVIKLSNSDIRTLINSIKNEVLN